MYSSGFLCFLPYTTLIGDSDNRQDKLEMRMAVREGSVSFTVWWLRYVSAEIEVFSVITSRVGDAQ